MANSLVGPATNRVTTEVELQHLMRAGLGGDADAHRTLLLLISGRLRAYFTPRLYGIARYKLLDYLRRSRGSSSDVPIEHAEEVIARDDIGAAESTFDV